MKTQIFLIVVLYLTSFNIYGQTSKKENKKASKNKDQAKRGEELKIELNRRATSKDEIKFFESQEKSAQKEIPSKQKHDTIYTYSESGLIVPNFIISKYKENGGVKRHISSRGNIMSEFTLNKYQKQEMSSIIIGDAVAAQGFSVDLSSESSVKFIGAPLTKRNLLTIELTAQQKNSNVSIIENGKYTGEIKLGVNYNFIEYKRKNPFIYHGFRYSKQSVSTSDRARYYIYDQINNRNIDTLMVYIHISEYLSLSGRIELNKFSNTIKESDDNLKEMIDFKEFKAKEAWAQIKAKFIDRNEDIKLSVEIYKKLINKYSKHADKSKIELFNFSDCDIYLSNDPSFDVQNFLKDYDTKVKYIVDRPNHIAKEEIELIKPTINNEYYKWISVSPYLSLSSKSFYEIDQDSLIINKDNKTIVYGGIKVFWNRYFTNKNIEYFRIGADLSIVNNLTKFQEVNYKKSTTLITDNSNSSLTVENSAKGYYWDRDSKMSYEPIVNLYVEYFKIRKKNSQLGYYLAGAWTKDDYFNYREYRVSIKIGTVINLKNKEKGKPIISIVPYLGFSNILPELVNHGDRLKEKPFLDRLSIGMFLGLPVSLSKEKLN